MPSGTRRHGASAGSSARNAPSHSSRARPGGVRSTAPPRPTGSTASSAAVSSASNSGLTTLGASGALAAPAASAVIDVSCPWRADGTHDR